MAAFLIKSKNNLNFQAKPRVYFTCHPEDFHKHFEKICGDIFKTHDCVIFYTEDFSEPIPPENLDSDLGRSNLLVVPVTYKLLSTPNRAMDEDIPYAIREHIPVLPLIMEPGLDSFYSQPDKFGQLQYLNPYGQDDTAISYEEKLKKHLDTVLVSDAMVKRIRAAFDAYIFLSYRKKDRKHANELMRLIHSYPECRDIAIWFDEFLTPGESFKDSIQKILNDSKMFALLVTPNLLEMPQGKANYVMQEEYPAAQRSGIPILPTEMEPTDKDSLRAHFENIPACIDPRDHMLFRDELVAAATRLAIQSNNTPEHNFLIGLAYMEGIDVEVDRKRGLELITEAAEAGLREAMRKLYTTYMEGIGATIDYYKANHWAQQLATSDLQEKGVDHQDTLVSISNLAYSYGKIGDFTTEAELYEQVYAIRCKLMGEAHPDTLLTLNNLSVAYSELGDYKKSLALDEEIYRVRCQTLGEEHPDTLLSLSNLSVTYGELGDNAKSQELKEKVYNLRCRILGEEHPDTLLALNNLAVAYDVTGNLRKALELKEKVYQLRCRILGEEHPNTLLSLSNLSVTHSKLGHAQTSLELDERVYSLRCKILGEEHPDTLLSLNNLAVAYDDLGKYQESLPLKEKVYSLRCKILGEDHPRTLVSLGNLAVTYSKLGEHQKALEAKKTVYDIRCRTMGEEHPETLIALSNLSVTYSLLGDHETALAQKEKVYQLRCKILGQTHPSTLISLSNLAVTYSKMGQKRKALELHERAYTLRLQTLGAEHPDTVSSRKNVETLRGVLSDE